MDKFLVLLLLLLSHPTPLSNMMMNIHRQSKRPTVTMLRNYYIWIRSECHTTPFAVWIGIFQLETKTDPSVYNHLHL